MTEVAKPSKITEIIYKGAQTVEGAPAKNVKIVIDGKSMVVYVDENGDGVFENGARNKNDTVIYEIGSTVVVDYPGIQWMDYPLNMKAAEFKLRIEEIRQKVNAHGISEAQAVTKITAMVPPLKAMQRQQLRECCPD